MRKFLTICVFVLLLGFLSTSFLPSPVFAATCDGTDTSLIECQNNESGIGAVISLVINIMAGGVGIVAVIGIAVFGIQYLTAQGDVNRTIKAKRRITEIVIGLVVFVLIYAISQWLLASDISTSQFSIFKNDNSIKSTSVTISFSSDNVAVGESENPTVTITPSNTTNKSYTLTSGNTRIATINGKSVTCNAVGKTTIKVTTGDGRTNATTLKCLSPDVAYSAPHPGSSTGGSATGNNTPSGGGSYFSPDQAGIADFQKKWDALGEQNYNELKKIANSQGITDDNFIGMVAWARFEGYENSGYGPYFAYLCNSVGYNSALAYSKKGLSSGWLDSIRGWGGEYANARYYGTEAYYQSNLKSIRMALDYPYPNIYGCSGLVADGGGYDPSVHKLIYAAPYSSFNVIFDGGAP